MVKELIICYLMLQHFYWLIKDTMYGLEITEEIPIVNRTLKCLHVMPISGNLGKISFDHHNFESMFYFSLNLYSLNLFI